MAELNPYDEFVDQALIQGVEAEPDPYAQFLNEAVEPEPIPEPELVEPVEADVGAVSNVFRGMGERSLTLLGNIAGFAQTTGQNVEDAAGVLDWLPELGGIVYDERGIRYLNADEWRTYNEGGGPLILRDLQESLDNYDLGYTPGTTWDDFKQAEGVFDSTIELAAFGLETGLVSIPDMVGAVGNLPVYMTSRAEEIAQERAANQGFATPSPEDMQVGFTTAAIIASIERFGANVVFDAFLRGGPAVQRILKAAVAEGTTEAVQEPVEFLAETYGTPVEEAMTPQEYWAAAVERGQMGFAGGFFGGGAIATPGAVMIKDEQAPTVQEPPIISPDVKTLEENTNRINEELARQAAEPTELEIAAAAAREQQAVDELEGMRRQTRMLDEQEQVHKTALHAEVKRRELEQELGPTGLEVERDFDTGEWKLMKKGRASMQRLLREREERMVGQRPTEAPIEVTEIATEPVTEPAPTTEGIEVTEIPTVEPEAIPQIGVTEADLEAEQITMARGPIYQPPTEPAPVPQQDLLAMAADIAGEPSPEQVAIEEEATEEVEPTGEATAVAETISETRPEFENLILSFKPGDERNGTPVPHYYGEIAGTKDADDMPVDVILNRFADPTAETPVYVVNQTDPETGEFIQHKVLAGFESAELAQQGYIDQFGTERLGNVQMMKPAEFKEWIERGDTTQPLDAVRENIARQERARADRAEDQRIRATEAQTGRLAPSPTDDVITFIRKMGGIDMLSQSEIPAGRLSHLNQENRMVGLPGIEQQGKGLNLDEVTERLWDAGFITENDRTQAIDLLFEAETEPQYTAVGIEEQTAAEFKAMTEAEFWAQDIEDDGEFNQVNPETARLMAIAESIDHDRMVDIASKDIPEADVQAELQAFIDEHKTNQANAAAAAAAADQARPEDQQQRPEGAPGLIAAEPGAAEPAAPRNAETATRISEYPWETLDSAELPVIENTGAAFSGRTYIVDQYSDRERTQFVGHAVLANFDDYRSAEKGYRDRMGDQYFVEITRTGGNSYDLDAVGFVQQGDHTKPWRELEPISRIEEQRTEARKAELAAADSGAKTSWLEPGQWAGIYDRYTMFDEPSEYEKVAHWGEEFKKGDTPRDYISHEEGAATIQSWKDHAAAQGEQSADLSYNEGNYNKTILSLFDATGEWAQPWIDAGYDVRAIDLKIDDVDIMDIDYEWLENMGFLEGEGIWGILAACPCTDFTGTGARDWQPGPKSRVEGGKDFVGVTHSSVDLVNQTLAIIDMLQPKFWALENPVGRIKKITDVPEPRLSFNPNNYGNPYTKKTQIYGNFNANLPTANVDPRKEFGGQGSLMHQMGSKDEREGGLRSVTPDGFAYAFFMANNEMDNPIQQQIINAHYKPQWAEAGIDQKTQRQTEIALQLGMAGLDPAFDLPPHLQEALEAGQADYNEDWRIAQHQQFTDDEVGQLFDTLAQSLGIDREAAPELELEAEVAPEPEPEAPVEVQEELIPRTEEEAAAQEIADREAELEQIPEERPAEAQEPGDLFAPEQIDIEEEIERTMDDVLDASRGVGLDVPVTMEVGQRSVTQPADAWLNQIDDRIRAISRLRGCA